MSAQSKVLRIALAVAMLTATPVVDAQTMVCGPNGCRMVQGQPARNVVRYAAAPAVRMATDPVRMVRRGLFGRARYSMAAPTVSSGSSGSYGTYQATTQSYGQSFGSSGGTAVYEASSGSSGGLGSYGDGPTDSRATAAPVTQEAPAASVPLGKSDCKCGPDCECGPDCQCQTQVCTVPSFAPSKRLCVVPPTSVSATCRVPASGPSVEAVASL
jgi:hypothetical protein